MYPTSKQVKRAAETIIGHTGGGLGNRRDDRTLGEGRSGIRRTHGTAQVGKAALLTDDLKKLLAGMDDGLLAMRDRALLLLGFAGAFRRSELVAVDVMDLAFVADGLIITVRRGKTDQDGAGMKKAIPFGHRERTCLVLAIRTWLEASGIESGAIFRSVNRHGQLQPGRLSDKALALVVKRRALAAGLDPQYLPRNIRTRLTVLRTMHEMELAGFTRRIVETADEAVWVLVTEHIDAAAQDVEFEKAIRLVYDKKAKTLTVSNPHFQPMVDQFMERFADLFQTADVILITDGISNFSARFLEEWAAARKRLGFHTYGILIGSLGQLPVMKQAIENVAFVSDFLRDDEAMDLLFRH